MNWSAAKRDELNGPGAEDIYVHDVVEESSGLSCRCPLDSRSGSQVAHLERCGHGR